MTIKEAEKRTGLTRSNIRFYEKEKLIVLSLCKYFSICGMSIQMKHFGYWIRL